MMAPDRERPVDVSAGSLRIRLAESAAEVQASQNLLDRYHQNRETQVEGQSQKSS